MFFKDNSDDEDEISCTPALAPSRLAQNVPGYLSPAPTGDMDTKVDSTSTSDHEEDVNNPIDANSGFGIENDEGRKVFKDAETSSFIVDPALSKSFLNFLHNIEDEEKPEAEVKVITVNVCDIL